MRLTCPNCDAQYEVPDEVVPDEGRDVQCSNCGQTWYQHHPDHMPQDAPTPPKRSAAPVADPPASQRPEPVQEPEPTPEPEPEPEAEEEETIAAPPPRELDPAVAKILQQEAEYEQQARARGGSDPLESQPDLGLQDGSGQGGDGSTLEARKRMARLRGEPEPMSDAAVNAAAISSRRDLLPDIEEINSTLRTEGDRDGQPTIDAPSEQRRKSGFRRGLTLMIVLFVLAALLYIFAPRLAEAVPQLEGALTAYVAWVDDLRIWLDGQVQRLAQWLDMKASQSSGAQDTPSEATIGN